MELKTTRKIISLAPNFDLNMSLFSRNKLLSKTKDGFISYFIKFVESNNQVKEIFKELDIPKLNEKEVDGVLSKYDLTMWNIDIKGYLSYREEILRRVCNI